MKKSTIRLAVEALKKQRRLIAVEAKLFKLGFVTHATVNADAKYEQITDAIADLESDGKPVTVASFSPVLEED